MRAWLVGCRVNHARNIDFYALSRFFNGDIN